jgi:hypothetical protein
MTYGDLIKGLPIFVNPVRRQASCGLRRETLPRSVRRLPPGMRGRQGMLLACLLWRL